MSEYFLLRRAGAANAHLAPDDRAACLAHLAMSRQKAATARELWAGRHRAEGLRLAHASLSEAVSALGPVGRDDVAARALLGDALPGLDADVAPSHAARFVDLGRARARLDAELTAALYTRGDVAALRTLRCGLLALGVTSALGVAAWRVVRPPPVAATASAWHTDPPGFGPERVLDGDAYTEWLLPPGQTGWVEVRFPRARAVSAVRVLNAHNRQSNDMATREFRVEAWAGERLLNSFRGAFPTLDPQPLWTRVPLAASGVTRVRVAVDSFHVAGGGLAELAFE